MQMSCKYCRSGIWYSFSQNKNQTIGQKSRVKTDKKQKGLHV